VQGHQNRYNSHRVFRASHPRGAVRCFSPLPLHPVFAVPLADDDQLVLLSYLLRSRFTEPFYKFQTWSLACRFSGLKQSPLAVHLLLKSVFLQSTGYLMSTAVVWVRASRPLQKPPNNALPVKDGRGVLASSSVSMRASARSRPSATSPLSSLLLLCFLLSLVPFTVRGLLVQS